MSQFTKPEKSALLMSNGGSSEENNNFKRSQSIEYDEIGEEFDFSDSDLKELNGNTNTNDKIKSTPDKIDNNISVVKPSINYQSQPNDENKQINSTNLLQIDGDPSLLPFCPMTPKKIIDCVDENDKCQPEISKTQKTNGNDRNDDAESGEEEYYSDEPEDELIVQFLGHANQIVCIIKPFLNNK